MDLKEMLSKKREDNSDEYIQNLHHMLMKEYGWIPFNEFKQLPIPTIVNLIETINIGIEQQNKARSK